MELTNFMLADAASAGGDGKIFIHGAGLSGISSSALPVKAPRISVFATFKVEPTDRPGTVKDLALTILKHGDDEPQPLLGTQIRLPEREEESPIPEFVNLILGLEDPTFPAFGLYWIVLSIDGDEASRLPFIVAEVAKESD